MGPAGDVGAAAAGPGKATSTSKATYTSHPCPHHIQVHIPHPRPRPPPLRFCTRSAPNGIGVTAAGSVARPAEAARAPIPASCRCLGNKGGEASIPAPKPCSALPTNRGDAPAGV